MRANPESLLQIRLKGCDGVDTGRKAPDNSFKIIGDQISSVLALADSNQVELRLLRAQFADHARQPLRRRHFPDGESIRSQLIKSESGVPLLVQLVAPHYWAACAETAM